MHRGGRTVRPNNSFKPPPRRRFAARPNSGVLPERRMRFVPPEEMIVHETPHWRINHRVKCPVPGYLMVGAKSPEAVELSDLTQGGTVGGRLSPRARDPHSA